MHRYQKNDILYPKHLNADNIVFSIFTSEEIRKISVCQVITPVIFDALGHPVNGGLYDKRLGTLNSNSEPCGTCNKNIYSCPGHFGHIELPLPVINPLFHRNIGKILSFSCFNCFHIQIPAHLKHTISIQLKLLNSGLVTEAWDIHSQIIQLISQYETLDNIPAESLGDVTKYEQLASKHKDLKFDLNKTTEALRNQFVNGLFKVITNKKKCLFCKEPLEKIQVLKNKIILSQRVVDPEKQVKASESKYITPEEARVYMRKIWKEEKEMLCQIFSVLDLIKDENPTDCFFFEVLPVPPPCIRPVNMMDGRILEHQQTKSYKNILMNALVLKAIISVIKNGKVEDLPEDARVAYQMVRGDDPIEKLNYCWEELQEDVNAIVDNTARKDGLGLKQIIEKKSGIIRMHMMGKRVNYSARSVITPDPNLNIDEIGIPEAFAKHLTYPVPVTSWNVEEMRKLILNGPNVHPGANMVEFEDGSLIRINTSNENQQKSMLKRLLTPTDEKKGFQGVKMVYRHLVNGDVLLLNRQPTLHKPSIMAHTARILKGEKTLRLHYANCKAYNADFDGDEMNAHFPQNEVARSEGYNLANVSNQYLVPKDGTPLSGLIQDHMISGVRLSIRGRFFDKNDYQQLVYQALSYKTTEIQLLPPAIMKPIQLWSGKQIMSTIIINIIPKGKALINLKATSKISAKAWENRKPRAWKAGGTPFKQSNEMSEAQVIIRNGELLVGVLDKTHYGSTPYGLIHCIYELYGGSYAIRLLSCFAKLFTRFLQQEGFTLGVRDILTVAKADAKRQKVIEKLRGIGVEVIRAALNLPEDANIDEIVEEIERASMTNPKLRAIIDRQYKTALDSYTNDINKACLPAGLVCKFPENNLQLMVQSGAKGSTVNTMQISCLLGQIELEGKRPPVMISGKSLPSFPVFEFAPRAGGFIDGRFMTGIQPQEFFFHCMAGREGLIDTAVKTSRSGYLQRCLIKHLEGLTIGYDMTVRDSDRSVIQFLYGEDGLDISKAQFLNSNQMEFLNDNKTVMLDKAILKQLQQDEVLDDLKKHQKLLSEWRDDFGNVSKGFRQSAFSKFCKLIEAKAGKKTKKELEKYWKNADQELKDNLKEQCQRCPDPVNSVFQPDSHFGSINERLEAIMKEFTGEKKKGKKEFEKMLKLKSMLSLCAPGEPVGLLAAQSIGEPSTQMTLNTFHFAGRGEMNVTLGIPRLREILMMASKNIKTPSMEIPFLPVEDLEAQAEQLRKKLTRVVLSDVLEKVDVSVQLTTKPVRQHKYILRFHFLPHKCYKSEYVVTPKSVLKHVRKKFFGEMFTTIKKYSKVKSNLVLMEEEKKKRKTRKNSEDDDNPGDEEQAAGNDLSSEDEVEDEEDAKATNKFRDKHEDQDPENEEKIASDEEEEGKESEQVADDSNEATVMQNYNYVRNYTEDKKHLWCELVFDLPIVFKKLDMTAILREAAGKSVIWETPQIKRAITYLKNDVLTLRTDGINIVEMFKYNKLLDLNKLYCNDIHKIAQTYGIEAAMKIIVKEVQDVFNVYGIKVDPRHLSLIADYMTFNGTFEPLSRKGMEDNASPLQQMSFEASLVFLKAAAIGGKRDDLQSPSSCLMIGKPCSTGTGCFSLLQKIPTAVNI